MSKNHEIFNDAEIEVVKSNQTNKNHCFMIRTECLENPNISFGATGILGYLASFPKGTGVSLREICAVNPRENPLEIIECLRELIEVEYAHLKDFSDDSGVVTAKYVASDFVTPDEVV